MNLKWLVAVFTLIAAVFVASAVVTYRTISAIDDEIADLKTNSLPSVAELTAARAELQRARLKADMLMLSADGWSAQDLGELHSRQDAMRAHLATYETTPWYPGERELFDGTLGPALDKLADASALIEHDGTGPVHQRVATDLGFDAAAGGVDEALSLLLDLNQAHAFSATETILDARRTYDRLALLLTLGAALVAAAAAAASLQLLRRQQAAAAESLQHEASRAAELEMFASRVGHDLLSPLSSVTLSLARIARLHDDPPTRSTVERSAQTLERCRKMVQGIYEFARSGARPGADGRASLRSAVKGAVDDVVASNCDPMRALDVEVEPFDDVEVACSPGVLDVILSNLLGNAAKYMYGCPVRRITVRARPVGGRARVEVEDTGPGVPPGLEATIFEPYMRADGGKQPGLGLGLATVKRVVECHGGAVGVRRSPDGGAIFSFDLPLAPPKAAEGAPAFRARAPAA